MSRFACVLVVVTSFCGCGRGIDRSIALVADTRLLAVRAEPPESAPGGPVHYTALVAGPTGTQTDAAILWSFCSSPAQPGEDSPVSSACLQVAPDPVATGNGVDLVTPANACRNFGPLGVPAQAGQPATQPNAPDATGGYRQPVQLVLNGDLSFAFERLSCAPAGVSLDLAQAFRATYTANQNPRLLGLAAEADGAPVDDGGVAVGAAVSIIPTWTAESWESYVMLDPVDNALATRAETLWLAWFVTGGALDSDFTVPPASTTSASNRWQAPGQGGTFYVWAVLHDDRGGIDFAELPIVVR